MAITKFETTRKELIDWINELKDIKLLSLLNTIRLSGSDKSEDWWDSLSETEKENIELGLKDINKGETINSKDFWAKLKNE
ncbi:MAG: hypothetical protein WD048_12970 [Chitinophagales bacterium]